MTPTRIVVIGAGGFGRETLDTIDAVNRSAAATVFDVVGVVDAGPSAENLERLHARGVRWLGTPSAWLNSGQNAQYVIGIGNPSARGRVADDFERAGIMASTIIHPGATLGSAVTLGAGSVVCGGVQISTNVALGRHVHVNPNATIGHDATLNDFVSINPGAIISGDVSLGSFTLVGAGAVVLQGLSIGVQALVGAGACVTRNVDAGRTVKGVPAR